jgi:hypothetical protein
MLEMLIAAQKKTVNNINIVRAQRNAGTLIALTDTGKLYGVGSGVVLGNGNTNVTTWTLISDSVSSFWLGTSTLVIHKKDNTWLFTGLQTPLKGNITTFVYTLTDITNFMSAVSAKTVNDGGVGAENFALCFTDGTMGIMGSNSTGAMFTGATGGAYPNMVLKTETGVKKVDVGQSGFDNTVYILYTDGTFKGAGRSQLGNMGSLTTSNPNLVTIDTGVEDFSIGTRDNIYYKKTSTGYDIYGLGVEYLGQLGDGVNSPYTTENFRTTKTSIFSVTDPTSLTITASVGHTFLNNNGTFYYTGVNNTARGVQVGDLPSSNLAVYTQMPSYIPNGTILTIRANTNPIVSNIMLLGGKLYGCGAPSSNPVLVGLSGAVVYPFTELATTGMSV